MYTNRHGHKTPSLPFLSTVKKVIIHHYMVDMYSRTLCDILRNLILQYFIMIDYLWSKFYPNPSRPKEGRNNV